MSNEVSFTKYYFTFRLLSVYSMRFNAYLLFSILKFFSRAELQYMVWFRLSEWRSTINEFFLSPQGTSLLKVSLWNITEYTFCINCTRKIVLHMLQGIWWDFIKWIRIAILVYICVLWCKKSYTICHYDHRHTLRIS